MKKKISIILPCYNEKDNILPLIAAIQREMAKVPQYAYEICFIDNDSIDGTRAVLEEVCTKGSHIRAIFNAKNFGQIRSPFYGLLQMDGDAVIIMASDFQDPPELISRYIASWQQGAKIVIGIKEQSDENKIVRGIRSLYYYLIRKMSSVEQINHCTGSGLYDRSFVEFLRQLDDPIPFLRGIIAEYGSHIVKIPFRQPKRRSGKSKNNWYSLFDVAMLSFTSYTKVGLRIATFVGFFFSALTMMAAVFYLVYKLLYWDTFQAGMAPVVIGMFFLGSVQLFFLGFLGEYVMSISYRIMHKPLVIEERRLNFPQADRSGADGKAP